MPRPPAFALETEAKSPIVLGIVTSAEWRRHVLLALRPHATVVCVPHGRWPVTTMSHRPDVVLVHLDPQIFSEASAVLLLTRLRKEYGDAALATYSDLSPGAVRLLASAIRFGIATTWLRGHDHLALRLAEFVAGKGAGLLVAEVIRVIEPLPASIRDAVLCSLQQSFTHVATVEMLADVIGVTRRTLVNRFRAAGFPPPSVFISWSRLLIAARLLENSFVSASCVARELHFASPSQFRGMLQRYTGLTPTELRQRGPLRSVAECFQLTRSVGSRAIHDVSNRHDSAASFLIG
jgi:AraC-like DNA-binding protein